MRKENALKNFITSVIPFAIFVILGFLKVNVWQAYLDENIYALNQLFFQLFAYLSIAEAGIGALVQKEYYKLLITEDREMVCKFYTVSKRMLRKVCYVIMILGIGLSFFLDKLANGNMLSLRYMQKIFVLFLAKSLVEYFLFSPRFVLTADQKLYKINLQMYFYKILEAIMEILLILMRFSYVNVLCVTIVLRVVMNIHLNKVVFREYPWLCEASDVNGIKIVGMEHVFIYKIVTAVQENVGALLISAFVNPLSVIIYTNYKYITKYLNDFIYQLGTSITSSLGNLLYGEDTADSYETYEMISTMFYFIATFLTIALGYCMNSFIVIWVGENKLFDGISFGCLLFVFFHGIARRPQYILKDIFALYKELQLISIAEAVVTLTLSFLLVQKQGISGILTASVLAILMTNFWYFPWMLYKKIFSKRPWLDYAKYMVNVLLCVGVLWISYKFFPGIPSDSIVKWFMGSCVYGIGLAVVLFLVFYVCFKSFRNLISQCVGLVKNMIKN